MHNHNETNNSSNHNGHDMKMMWLMMIFCSLPLIWTLFAGRNFNLGANKGWLIIVATILVAHFWLMKKMHHGTPSKNGKTNE